MVKCQKDVSRDVDNTMFLIQNNSKQNPLSTKEDFVRIKEEIIGKKYNLSLVFELPEKSQELNYLYRQKDYVPNVLSFPIDEKEGEIYICIKKAKEEAKEYEMSQKNFIRFLFIHALLHLKGYDHGKEMEKLEEKFKKKFC